MHKVKIIQVGDSAGIVLPDDILSHLGVSAGDTLIVTEAPDGLVLSADGESQAAKLERARVIMLKRRGALRELAK